MRAGHIVYKSFGDDIGDKRWSIFREEEHSEKLENPNIFEPMPINDLWLSKMVGFRKIRNGGYIETNDDKNIIIAISSEFMVSLLFKINPPKHQIDGESHIPHIKTIGDIQDLYEILNGKKLEFKFI